MLLTNYIISLMTIMGSCFELKNLASQITTGIESYQNMIADQFHNFKLHLDLNSKEFRQKYKNFQKYGVYYVEDNEYDNQDQELDTEIEQEIQSHNNWNHRRILQNTTSQNTTGQNTTGQNTTGQNATGQNTTGQNTSAYNITVQTATGQNTTGLNLTGKNTTSNKTQFNTTTQQPIQPQFCVKNGQPILINQTYFYCNNQQVSWSQYNKTVENANVTQNGLNVNHSCVQTNQLEYACLCPKDHHGVYCELNNPFVCDFDSTLIRSCPSYDSFYYNSAIDGDPPCVKVNQNTVYNDVSRSICYNMYQDKLNETVTSDQPFQIIWSNYTPNISKYQADVYYFYYPNEYQLTSNEFKTRQRDYFDHHDEINEKNVYFYTPFVYYYEFGGILASSSHIEVQPRVIFIDWAGISNTYYLDTQFNLTENQVSGLDTFVLQINFSQLYNLSLQNFGRFSYQIDLISFSYYQNYTEVFLCSLHPKTGYFEDETYQEPGNITQISKGLVLGLTILFCFLIALFIYLIIFCKRKMDKLRLERALEEHRSRILQQNENLG